MTIESSYKFVCWYGQGHIAISLWLELSSILCEGKINKQGLQAGESWLQNSNRSMSKKQNKNETEIWIEKDGFKTGNSNYWAQDYTEK